MIKPFKNGFFSANIDNKNLPKNNKPFHVKDALTHKIKLYGLKPNQTIFYFAANQRDFTKSIKPRSIAYGKLENSGITRVNKDGEVNVYIHCPQLYVNQDGKIYSRHMHFLYWDNKNNEWNKNLYTQELLCTLKKDYIITKNVHIVDARLEGKHIDGYVSMPYNKRWTEEKVLEALQISKTNKLAPILIYSDSTNELYNKLNKLGFYNTMKYIQNNTKSKNGGGRPPFDFLVIGSSDSEINKKRYNNFFEVGNHETSDFGAKKDWHDIRFWNELETYLNETGLNFKAIIFGEGSASHLYDISDECMDKMGSILKNKLIPNGIIIAEGERIETPEFIPKISNNFYFKQGMNLFGKIIFNDSRYIYNLFCLESKNKNTVILSNKNGIYKRTQIFGKLYLNPSLKYYINYIPGIIFQEKNQIDFIKKRIPHNILGNQIECANGQTVRCTLPNNIPNSGISCCSCTMSGGHKK